MEDIMHVQVINTNRESNSAYVALCYIPYIDQVVNTINEKWYWSTNLSLYLDEIESYTRVKFEDGEHPFFSFVVYNIWETFKVKGDIN